MRLTKGPKCKPSSQKPRNSNGFRQSGDINFSYIPILVLIVLISVPISEAQEPAFLEEIIVIAQKREEPAQDVPIAVTYISGKTILDSGMLSLVQLTEMHPSVSFDVAQNMANASLKIRGIGTVGNGRNFEGSVGAYIDGVYRPRSAMVLSDLTDIAGIEVLRGPQGTLFGKNTVAGALAVTSNRPSFEGTTGNLELRAGDYNTTFVAGMFNTPLNDTAAMRVSGSFNRRDAFFTSPDNGDDYDAIDRFNLKAQFQFNPVADLDILLITDYAKSDADCCWGSPTIVNGPSAPLIETYAAVSNLSYIPVPISERKRSGSLNTLPREETEEFGINFQVVKEFESGTLKSITAYREWENIQTNTDPDFGPADLLQFDEPTKIDFFSQEFNFITQVGETDLLLGFYYDNEDFSSIRDVRTGSNADDFINFLVSAGGGAVACLPPVLVSDCLFPIGVNAFFPDGSVSIEGYNQSSESWAIFGHGVTPLGENWELVTGLRYSNEEKDGGVDNIFWYDSPIIRAAFEGLGIPDDGTPRNGFDFIGVPFSPSFKDRTDDEELTGTISLQFRPTDDVMVYGGYYRGYKASGINLFREAVITNTTTYAPETADSFEIGVKMDYLSGRARTNVALFHTDFSDMQINFFENLTFRTDNTAESSTEGLEVENAFQVTENLRVDLAVTFMEAKFDRIDTESLKYLEGRETPRAPDMAGVLTIDWDKPLTDRLDVFARGTASYTGDHYVSPDIPNEEKADSYTLADISIGLRSEEDQWEILAWCNNCTDESYRTILINTPFQPGTINAYLGAPRQYGLTFRKGF